MIDTQSELYKKLHFAVMAIEATAKNQQVSGDEMYRKIAKL